jgi:DNA invertase Pin-like site-specific DNA recombinase
MATKNDEHVIRRAAIYARVSSGVQATPEKQSTEVQIQQCREWIAHPGRSWAVEPRHVYQEVGKRHQYRTRAGLQEMLAAAARHEFDVVVVWCLDRLTDDPDHFMDIIGHLWTESRVQLKSATDTQDVDITTQRGRWMAYTMVQWMVAPENPRRAQGTNETRKQYARQRTRLGKPLSALWLSLAAGAARRSGAAAERTYGA